jgi:hypothetical protein
VRVVSKPEEAVSDWEPGVRLLRFITRPRGAHQGLNVSADNPALFYVWFCELDVPTGDAQVPGHHLMTEFPTVYFVGFVGCSHHLPLRRRGESKAGLVLDALEQRFNRNVNLGFTGRQCESLWARRHLDQQFGLACDCFHGVAFRKEK